MGVHVECRRCDGTGQVMGWVMVCGGFERTLITCSICLGMGRGPDDNRPDGSITVGASLDIPVDDLELEES